MVVLKKLNISATTVLVFSLIPCMSSTAMLLDSMCGILLQDSCSQLQHVEVKASESCAERAPWNVILERRGGRRKRTVYRDYTRIRDKRAPSDISILCGGTLVSSLHVVTAASCLWDNKGRARTCKEPFLSMTPEQCKRNRCPTECVRLGSADINVYLGVTDRTQKPKPRAERVSKVFLHPNWDRLSPLNTITSGHDLAVIELVKPVTFSSTIWPICLPAIVDKPLLTTNNQVDALGFVSNELNECEQSYGDIINKASLHIADQKECRSYK